MSLCPFSVNLCKGALSTASLDLVQWANDTSAAQAATAMLTRFYGLLNDAFGEKLVRSTYESSLGTSWDINKPREG